MTANLLLHTPMAESEPAPPRPQEPTASSSSSSESQPLLSSQNRRFVDPDDPIVSPLNLVRIRALRFGLLIILLFNSIVFLGCFVSDFVGVPGFTNRGKSFLELNLVIFSLLSTALSVWCFDVPSYYERIVGYLTLALFVVDFVVVFTVAPLRDQLGLFGNFLLLWTVINIAVGCVADHWVQNARDAQEIKYTGRVETRRSIYELLVMSTKVLMKLVLFLIAWNISLSLWLTAFDTHEKPWGDMVSVNEGDFQVHLSCYGDLANGSSKQPIVLLEGGQRTSSEVFQEWVEELYHLNKVDRYCLWDRPGYGFSDSAPSPVSLGIITEYLMEALQKKGIDGPFSLVGFDSGGLYTRMFALRNPGKVDSILLVDSWHEDMLKHNPFSGSNKKKESKKVFRHILEFMDTRTGIKLWFKGLISPLGIVTNFHWFFHPRRYSANSRIFGHDMLYSLKYLRARLQEQVTASILSYNEVLGSDVHNVPLSVISSDFMIKNSLNWGKWQRELTKISEDCLEWVVAESSGHKIWESPKGRKSLQDLLLRLLGEKTGA